MALIYEKKGKIVTMTFNRPDDLNSFNKAQAYEFTDALIDFRDDPNVWVAIVTGTGDKAFSAGADLVELVPECAAKGELFVTPTTARGLKLVKPVIAAINGIAMGAGLEVALGCDIRIASENATFGVPEVRWGVIPGWGGTQRLPRMMPRAKAMEMLLMGTSIDAKEAYRLGLINAVVPLADLMSTARKWAEKICSNAPLAVRAAKESVMLGVDMPLNEALETERLLTNAVLRTKDAAEGPKAFAEKRKPVYKAE
ncbi:MAG: enoyl-CoA hydratase-related protein [Dehalococcoidia bacterium]